MNDHKVMCAEMNCDWVGDCPAVAACPLCGSHQLRLEPIRWIQHPSLGLIAVCGPVVVERYPAQASVVVLGAPEVLP